MIARVKTSTACGAMHRALRACGLSLILLSTAAFAQQAGETTEPIPAQGKDSVSDKTQKVTVTAARLGDDDQRRLSTAAKMVFGRDELDRNADSTIGEILKRLPGVTIGGRPGRGGDIRMRGLGSGYTQILVNGERPPRGFSLDTIAPDQVERIEIYRAPVAEFSTQAIAGTINVILREDYQQRETQVRISDAIEGGRHAPNLSVSHPGELGGLSYVLSALVFQNRQRSEVTREEIGLDPQGQTILDQTVFDDSMRRTRGVQLAPRLSYRAASGDMFVLQPFVMQTVSESLGNSVLSQSVGTSAPYNSAHWSADAGNTVARLFSTWQHRFDNGGRLTTKFGAGSGSSHSESTRYQYGLDGSLRNTMLDTNSVSDHSANTGAKYTYSLGGGHALALGADGEWSWRSQTRTSLDNGAPQFVESGENLNAQTRRLASFVQDEWDITPQWAASMGLRWEGITTTSERPGSSLSNQTSVWSPVGHVVWRIPGAQKNQIRASITHSYRAPPLADLIAVPVLSPDNSPTRPDRIGNPELKPEMSTGVDLAFEHYLTQNGIISASLFKRSIEDLIRRQTTLVSTSSGQRWTNQPFNIGHATTSGIELEAKFPLTEFLAGAPTIDVRSNFSRFWSQVDGISGPDNRLDQQPTMTANFGMDYRVGGMPLTLGGNLNWTPGYKVQTSEFQASTAGIKRQFDVYGLWKFTPSLQLRLSANNLVNSNYLTGSSLVQGGVNQSATISALTYTVWTAKLEMKL